MPTSAADQIASRLEEEVLRLARHGSFRAAADVCRVLNTKHPQYAPGWRAASGVALQMGDASAALTLIERALAFQVRPQGSVLIQPDVIERTDRAYSGAQNTCQQTAKADDQHHPRRLAPGSSDLRRTFPAWPEFGQ